jgi:hypothetical protein
MFIVAIGLTVGGLIFFRHHKKELLQRAENAIPEPILGAPPERWQQIDELNNSGDNESGLRRAGGDILDAAALWAGPASDHL